MFDETVETEDIKPKGDPLMGLPPNVLIEEASKPFELQPPNPHAEGPWVQYNGIATVRFIDEKSWRDAGIKSTKYCEWNYLNHKRLPKSSFTEEELDYLLRRDGRFSLVDN